MTGVAPAGAPAAPVTGPFDTLLVANRGEIACRVMRTAAAMGLTCVAVFSDPDADAPHVALADRAVRLPGRTPAQTYLDGAALIAAARATGAQAVHPGYGFLSENAGFAQACADAGLIFVGPPPRAIAAMGDKLSAKRLLAAAGVPTLPGAQVGPDTDDAALAAAGREVGYPLLVKAAFGGGGRGMRRVDTPDELAGAVAAAAREAASAFGDGTVFLERLVVDPRHIEVQIFSDAAGHHVALFERECSVQRRHQKVIEEAPSPAVGPALRARMSEAAVAAARTLDYRGAGTVEFVVDADGGFFFLEVNTRLQVEHPVTELVTGLDLVRLQLQVAAGLPLPPQALEPQLSGWAIEGRLYAEDPAAGWLPQAGTLHRFTVPAAEGVRVDAGVGDGSVIGTDYDPMLAKVIAWAPTRDEAARRLARALRTARVHGPTTNRDLLVRVLEDPGFRAGATDTGLLERTPGVFEPLVPAGSAQRHLAAAAAALAATDALLAAAPGQAAARAAVHPGVPAGWRNNPTEAAARILTAADVTHTVTYRQSGRTLHGIAVDATAYGLSASADPPRPAPGGGWDVAVTVRGGPGPEVTTRLQVLVVTDPAVDRRVDPSGATVFTSGADGGLRLVEGSRYPDPAARLAAGSLTAPMPGTVSRVLAAAGDSVAAGQPLLVLEAMKMEHTLTATADGTLAEVRVTVGSQVRSGEVLAVVAASPAPA